MKQLPRYAGQAAFYALLVAALGYGSALPYTHFPPEQALIKVSFAHSGAPATECRRLTPEELAKLPPNMRRPRECPRGRVPLRLELAVDGELLIGEDLVPTGLFGDGPARIYRRLAVSPGQHRIEARLWDGRARAGAKPDYLRVVEVDLAPRRNLAVDFRADTGGFIFR
jgi:hypothetical protein